MQLSIVLVNYKTPKQLCECIDTIYKSYKEADDIIVIDNDSQDESIDLVRKTFPEVRVVASRLNGGFAMAANWGFNLARHDTILLLNPDILVQNNAIQKLYDALHSDSSIGIVASKLLNFDGTLQYSCFRFHKFMTPFYRRTVLGKWGPGKKELARFEMTDWDHNDQRDIDWALGGSLMIKREVLEKIGLMDDRYFLYFEDVDLCRTVWENGYRVVYVPDAIMMHEHQRLSAHHTGLKSLFNRVTRIHIRSWMKYWWKP